MSADAHARHVLGRIAITTSSAADNAPPTRGSLRASAVRYRSWIAVTTARASSPRRIVAGPLAEIQRSSPGSRLSTTSVAVGRAATFLALRLDDCVATQRAPSRYTYQIGTACGAPSASIVASV